MKPSPNLEQTKAIKTSSQIVAVIAGPGTGKTFTLTQRILWLINEKKIPPEQILVATYTRKATQELQARIANTLKHLSGTPRINTLHKFCFDTLTDIKQQPPQLVAAGEQKKIIKEVIKRNRLQMSARQLLLTLNRYKSESSPTETEKNVALAINAYQNYLKFNQLVDFDDLILEVISQLRTDAFFQEQIQKNYTHILVDEFQDINDAQQELLFLLAGKNSQLFVIGDPNQSIYGFRGAKPQGFERLFSRFPQTEVITLINNYRSGQTILDIAATLTTNTSNHLQSQHTTANKITILQTPDEHIEAKTIIELIQQLLGGVSRQNFDTNLVDSHFSARYTFSDIAILFRSHSQMIPFKHYLTKSGIPYTMDTRLDALDDKTMQSFWEKWKHRQIKDESMPLENFVKQLSQESGLSPTYEPFKELLRETKGYEWLSLTNACNQFEQMLALFSYDEQAFFSTDKVMFMTIHASKGLEFPVVVVPGLEEGLLPHFINGKELAPEKLQEEQRLCYVALTRAKENVYLSHTKSRIRFGRTYQPQLSRFVQLFPPELYETHTVQQKKKPIYQPKLF